ncbi:hypothetical protein HKD37_03G006427 [Glycine soja]
MKIARLFPGLGKDRRGHGFKHLDLQQCEKFKEFGAPEFHHDCAKELEIHTMADSNSGTPNSFNFSHCKNNNQRPRISIHHIEIQPEDISIHLCSCRLSMLILDTKRDSWCVTVCE